MKTSDFFILPKIPQDALLRADADCMRVLILLYQSPGMHFKDIKETLKLSCEKLKSALTFWYNENILDISDIPAHDTQTSTSLTSHSAEELASSRLYNAEYSAIIERAERMWGALSRSDLDALYGALNELKLPIEVVLMLLRYLKDTGAPNMKKFERTAIDWSKRGLFSAKAAQNYIDGLKKEEDNIHRMAELIGLSYESLSATDKKTLSSWSQKNYTDNEILDVYKKSLQYTNGNNPIAYMNKVLANDNTNANKKKSISKNKKQPSNKTKRRFQ